MNLLLRSASVLALATAAFAASAQTVLYSNLGTPPSTYSGTAAYNVDANTQGVSGRFVATSSGPVSSFSGAVNNDGQFGAGPLPYTLGIYADNAGQRGSLLASYGGLTTGDHVTSGTTDLSTVSTPNGPILLSGTAYWIGLTSTNNITWNWNVNYYGVSDGLLINGTRYTGATPAFALVTLYPTPEPASFAALGLGAVAVLRRRKRA